MPRRKYRMPGRESSSSPPLSPPLPHGWICRQGIGVTGVHVSSLPPNAISYYEAEDVSVVFEIPMGQVHTTHTRSIGQATTRPRVPGALGL